MLESLRIENSGVPIYVQIRDQMQRAIGAGLLRPGDQMPTMRQVSVALRVDLNTVKHAYDELEKMGAINIVQARGCFVAERLPPPQPEQQAARVDELANRTIATAQTSGVDPTELADRILAIMKGGNNESA
jgi:GntR family transcriptional regulator